MDSNISYKEFTLAINQEQNYFWLKDDQSKRSSAE